MLTSEFENEMGALIRSLQQKIRQEPGLFTENSIEPRSASWAAKEHLDRAIIALIAMRLSL